ncbi:amidase [Marinobacteraceae bacterium S3BR75-40.1]
MTYDLRPIQAPRLTGAALKAFVRVLEHGYAQRLLKRQLERETGLQTLRSAQLDQAPTGQPWHTAGPAPSLEKAQQSRTPVETAQCPQPFEQTEHQPPTVQAFAAAYRAGRITPEQVAERLLEALEHSNSGSRPLRAVVSSEPYNILQQARESTRRIQEGSPRSILEGVPVAIKDELDALPYSTRVGTRFLGEACCEEDATSVARLRAAGALILGKTNMHEIGIGVTGANPHFGHCRNPYNPDRFTGGSSSGSAAAVAAGLCPLAVGADGGGSVRIPAALCGVVGLKPTWGRISEKGAAPLCWSVAHVGPMGTSVADVALGYLLMAGPDIHDPWTLHQPNVHLLDFLNDKLAGVRIGVFRPWFRDADRDVVDVAEAALQVLLDHGATRHEVTIENLELQRVAHTVTIASEMRTAMGDHYDRHREQFALDTRVNLALTNLFSATDYVQAQRVRTLAIKAFQKALDEVDVMILPTTSCTAPPIRPDAVPHGESDLRTMEKLMRFVTPSNLTGFPAITVPAGYDSEGLPVGVQLIGRAWDEHLLLRLARIIEAAAPRQRPAVFSDLLEP